MAILLAMARWRVYLQLVEFFIYNDHQSLAQLNEQRLHTLWQHKVYSKLAGLQYKIIYKKGCDNAAADALSRYPHDSTQLWSIFRCTPLCVRKFCKDMSEKQLLNTYWLR